jgi:phospholipid N-methyltransferase
MSQLAESLLKCRVEENTVFLPPMSDGPLPNYQEVRTALLKAGAKYKRNTFVFNSAAQPFVDRLTGGGSVNIKKEFQFFETPSALALRMVDLAEIYPDHEILEPSAGQGAIIKAIHKTIPGKKVWWCEIMPENERILHEIKDAGFMYNDFMEHTERFKYDRIIANPPFSKNQDIEHIKKMYTLLRNQGRIVTIASKSWTFGSQKKQTAFREWLDEIGATVEEIPPGTFKETGTNVSAMLLIINRAV